MEQAALAYGNPPKVVAFSEKFLQDDEAFFRAMDAVSHGRFLLDDDFFDVLPKGNNIGSSVGSSGMQTSAKRGFSGKGGDRRTPTGVDPTAAGVKSFLTNNCRGGIDDGTNSKSNGKWGVGGGGGGASGVGLGGESWLRYPWLTGMGTFSLAAFLANR